MSGEERGFCGLGFLNEDNVESGKVGAELNVLDACVKAASVPRDNRPGPGYGYKEGRGWRKNKNK
jgi:hypothetical protein